MVKLERYFDGYRTKDNKYKVTLTNSRIKGLYPKYFVYGGLHLNAHASTLKEAREIIDTWENARYRITFDFKINDPSISDGCFHSDYLDNNGEGYSFNDAQSIAKQLKASTSSTNMNIHIENLEA